MSRTDLDATTLANSLRTKAGDGSMEWVMEPIQASVLLDIADMLDENAKLRERAVAMLSELRGVVSEGDYDSPSGRYWLLRKDVAAYEDALRELGIEV